VTENKITDKQIGAGRNMYELAHYIGKLFGKKVTRDRDNSVRIHLDHNECLQIHEGQVYFYSLQIGHEPLKEAIEQLFDVKYVSGNDFQNNGTW